MRLENDVISHYCIFLYQVPPWRWPERSKHVGGLPHVSYSIISNFSAVIGIFSVVVSWVWVFVRRVGFWQVDWLKMVKKIFRAVNYFGVLQVLLNFHKERVLLEGIYFVVKFARLFWNRTEYKVTNHLSYFVPFLLKNILLYIIHIYVIRDYVVEEGRRGVWRWSSRGRIGEDETRWR
jgi:hypothetical protein